jgi:predicted small lipoprotein YifL
MNIKTLLVASVLVPLLAACGNKGPLVMPQKPVPVEQEMPAPPPAETPPATEPGPAVDPALQDQADDAVDDPTGGDGDG